jgi:hypothetical protein
MPVSCPLCNEQIVIPEESPAAPSEEAPPMEFVPLAANEELGDDPNPVDELIDHVETVELVRVRKWLPRLGLLIALWIGAVVVVGGVHLHSITGEEGLRRGATEVTARFGWFLNPLQLVVDVGALPRNYSREQLGALLQGLARIVPLVPGMGIEFSSITVKQDGDLRFRVVGVVWHELARADEMSPRDVLQFFAEHARDAEGRTMESRVGRNAEDPTHAAETIFFQTLVPDGGGTKELK